MRSLFVREIMKGDSLKRDDWRAITIRWCLYAFMSSFILRFTRVIGSKMASKHGIHQAGGEAVVKEILEMNIWGGGIIEKQHST